MWRGLFLAELERLTTVVDAAPTPADRVKAAQDLRVLADEVEEEAVAETRE